MKTPNESSPNDMNDESQSLKDSDTIKVRLMNPAVFSAQMKNFEPMLDDMLTCFNSKICNLELKLSREELMLKNELDFFTSHPLFIKTDSEHLYDFEGNLGSTGIRFNLAIDKLLALIGHDYLIKSGLYDPDYIDSIAGHPLILDYGTSSSRKNASVSIDRNARYSFYDYRETKSPIVIDRYSNESLFTKEIIKRSLGGYFYKDKNSVGIFQKIHFSPDAGIKITLLNILSNYASLLDLMANIIDFVFDINLQTLYKSKTTTYYNGEKKPNNNEPTAININWSVINLLQKELIKKECPHATKMAATIKESRSLLEKSPTIQQGRNLITHRGFFPVEYLKENKKGVFILFQTKPNNMKANDPEMTKYFDATEYCVSKYAAILKLYNNFYKIFFDAMGDNATTFKNCKLSPIVSDVTAGCALRFSADLGSEQDY